MRYALVLLLMAMAVADSRLVELERAEPAKVRPLLARYLPQVQIHNTVPGHFFTLSGPTEELERAERLLGQLDREGGLLRWEVWRFHGGQENLPRFATPSVPLQVSLVTLIKTGFLELLEADYRVGLPRRFDQAYDLKPGEAMLFFEKGTITMVTPHRLRPDWEWDWFDGHPTAD